MKKFKDNPVWCVFVDILYLIWHFVIVIAALAAFLGLAIFAEWFASII